MNFCVVQREGTSLSARFLPHDTHTLSLFRSLPSSVDERRWIAFVGEAKSGILRGSLSDDQFLCDFTRNTSPSSVSLPIDSITVDISKNNSNNVSHHINDNLDNDVNDNLDNDVNDNLDNDVNDNLDNDVNDTIDSSNDKDVRFVRVRTDPFDACLGCRLVSILSCGSDLAYSDEINDDNDVNNSDDDDANNNDGKIDAKDMDALVGNWMIDAVTSGTKGSPCSAFTHAARYLEKNGNNDSNNNNSNSNSNSKVCRSSVRKLAEVYSLGVKSDPIARAFAPRISSVYTDKKINNSDGNDTDDCSALRLVIKGDKFSAPEDRRRRPAVKITWMSSGDNRARSALVDPVSVSPGMIIAEIPSEITKHIDSSSGNSSHDNTNKNDDIVRVVMEIAVLTKRGIPRRCVDCASGHGSCCGSFRALTLASGSVMYRIEGRHSSISNNNNTCNNSNAFSVIREGPVMRKRKASGDGSSAADVAVESRFPRVLSPANLAIEGDLCSDIGGLFDAAMHPTALDSGAVSKTVECGRLGEWADTEDANRFSNLHYALLLRDPHLCLAMISDSEEDFDAAWSKVVALENIFAIRASARKFMHFAKWAFAARDFEKYDFALSSGNLVALAASYAGRSEEESEEDSAAKESTVDSGIAQAKTVRAAAVSEYMLSKQQRNHGHNHNHNHVDHQAAGVMEDVIGLFSRHIIH